MTVQIQKVSGAGVMYLEGIDVDGSMERGEDSEVAGHE
jgi:hypothetical protein